MLITSYCSHERERRSRHDEAGACRPAARSQERERGSLKNLRSLL